MKIDINVTHKDCAHRQAGPGVRIESMFGTLLILMEIVMGKLDDVKASLTNIGTQVEKISGETQSLVDKVAKLEAVNPNQEAQIDEIATMAQSIADKLNVVDGMVKDPENPVPPVDPVEPPTGEEPPAVGDGSGGVVSE